jgi:hypothetical protein
MVKKNNNMLMTVIILAVVIIMFNLNWSKPNIEINNQLTDNSVNNSEINNSQNVPNLCSLMTPYVFVFNLQSQCISNGGMWTCNENNIGCYTMTRPILDCNLAVVKTALSQCTSTGGKPYCDAQTVSCKY